MLRLEQFPLLLLLASGCTCGDDLTAGAPEPDPDAADAADSPDARAAADASPDADPRRPMRLEETGLYADFDSKTIAPDVIEYAPQFELWADGAIKRRWVKLPAGSTIDTSDMDFWVYPEDTMIWKQFAVGATLVETRLWWKQGPAASDWRPFAFAWDLAQTDAVAITDGATDALGTGHEIPNLFQCGTCHDQPDILLGFSAIQLDATGAGFGLDDLIAAGTLSDDPPGAAEPFFPLPGSPLDQAALGYLHGNCGGCHFIGGNVQDLVPLELRLDVGNMSQVSDTAAHRTAVGVNNVLPIAGATAIIEPGDPDASAIHLRMNSTRNIRMPAIGSSVVDPAGLAAVDAWINVVTP